MNTRQERHEEAIDPVAADWLYRSESTEAGLSVSRMAADADRIAREIDRQILDDRPVPEILQWLCGQVAGTFDCPMVWVGLRENSGRISVQAKHGPKASILDSLELRWDDCPAGRGPAGRAIRTGHPQKAVFFRDECLRTWESAAAEYQFKVVYAVPLVAKGSTLGVMGFHCHSDDHYHAVSPVLNRFADRVALSLLHGQARDTIRLQDAVLES
ncbi:MAG: GAF domain-containing protein, partial [Gemmatimonadales bacterium]